MIARIQRRVELIFAWLIEPKRKPLAMWAAGVILLVVAAISFDVHERQVERHARNVAVSQAARIAYENQLASCARGISVRNDLRTYGQEFHLVGNVFVGFFGTAVRRARAQSMDKSVSPATRAAAKAALPQYSQFVATVKLLTSLPIPPAPKPCDQVITDPNAPPVPTHR